MYVVLRKHLKFQDTVLNVGDRFSKEDMYGVEPKRLERLISKLLGLGRIEKLPSGASSEATNSKKSKPKIRSESDISEIKSIGGPWWLLPDGRKIMGKDKALNALKAG